MQDHGTHVKGSSHEKMGHSPDAGGHGDHGKTINYNINLQSDPATPEAGKPARLALVVTEQSIGDPITEFDAVHDKLMHLVIVNSKDLSYFAHLHPQLDNSNGIFTVTHTFPESGEYKMWADAKSKGGTQCLVAFRLNVTGLPFHAAIELVPDSDFTKKSIEGNYQVSVKLAQKITAHRNIDIIFELADAKGTPLRDLEPIMGAGGHCVIISSDAREFLHVHPVEEVSSKWRGGPQIAFIANFPRPGLYKIWGQFQQKKSAITESFTVRVGGNNT